jgi:hypothetical protein
MSADVYHNGNMQMWAQGNNTTAGHLNSSQIITEMHKRFPKTPFYILKIVAVSRKWLIHRPQMQL